MKGGAMEDKLAHDGTDGLKCSFIRLGQHWTLGETESGKLLMEYKGEDGEYVLTVTPAPVVRHSVTCGEELKKQR